MPNNQFNMDDAIKQVNDAQDATGQNVWLTKYKFPVYTDLKRADEIMYATDTQVLNREKNHYFALQDLGTPTEELAKNALKGIPFSVLQGLGPGVLGGYLLGKTQFMRGATKAGVDLLRQTAAGTLKQGAAGAAFFGQDIDSRLARKREIDAKMKGLPFTMRLQENLTQDFKAMFEGLKPAEVEFAKARVEAFAKEQAKVDAFNEKVKNVLDNFTARAGFDKTAKDGFWYDLGAAGSSLLFSVGALALTRNPAIVAGIFGVAEGQGTYEQAIEAGIEPNKAFLQGEANALWVAATEVVGETLLNKLLFTHGVLGNTFRRIVDGLKKSGVKKQTFAAGAIGGVQGALIEGTQEAVQNVGSDLIHKFSGIEDKSVENIIKDASYAFVLAALPGGPVGAVGGAGNFLRISNNLAEALEKKGFTKEEAQTVARATALESISEETVDDTLKAVSGEINSPLTAEDRDPQAFKTVLTESQQRQAEQNAWDQREQLKEQAMAAGMNEEQAEASAAIGQENMVQFHRLTGLAPEEMQYMKINVLKGGNETTGNAPKLAQEVLFQDPATYDETGKARTDRPEFKAYFEGSKVVDDNGQPLVVYHGTARADRVGEVFLPERATSGPMAFFTDKKEIAQNYARDKEDTSLSREDWSYKSWYKISVKGGKYNLEEAWNKLPATTRNKITRNAVHITEDDDGNLVFDRSAKRGNGGLDDYTIRENNGNMLMALQKVWLEDGALFNEEERFAEVLKLAGLKESEFEYENPNAKKPGVFDVYLAIKNPLDTGTIPSDLMQKLETAAQNTKTDGLNSVSDFWDKNRRDPMEWVTALKEDTAAGKNSFVWSSIPDWVTDVLKAEGYDGIKDTGGKAGGQGHTVWIPFYSNQIKSVHNQGTFDVNNPNIYHQAAYHGTPHKFDTFSTEHIGTGEGAQAHGWGLYFAQDKEVSDKRYRKRLIRDNQIAPYSFELGNEEVTGDLKEVLTDIFINSKALGKEYDTAETVEEYTRLYKHSAEEGKAEIDAMQAFKEKLEKAETVEDVARLESEVPPQWTPKVWIQSFEKTPTPKEALEALERYKNRVEYTYTKNKRQYDLLKTVDGEKLIAEENNGQLFEVDLPENDVLLDEDLPYSKQPKKVKEALKKLFLDHGKDIKETLQQPGVSGHVDGKVRGDDIYDEVKKLTENGKAKEASLLLNKYGIKGITYNGGIDGRSFVIFDDKAVKTLNTYYQSKVLTADNLTQIHDKDGNVVDLKENKDLKPFAVVDLPNVELQNFGTQSDLKRVVSEYILQGKDKRTFEKDGHKFVLSKGSIKKMINTTIASAGEDVARQRVRPQDRGNLYQTMYEIVANVPQIFETSQLVLSHKDVKGVTGRTMFRYGNAFSYKGNNYYAEVVVKNDEEMADLIVYDLQTKKAMSDGISATSDRQRQTSTISIDEIKRFVKGKLLKYNKDYRAEAGTKDNTRIYNQNENVEHRGSVAIDEDANQAIIRIFEKGDASTIVHELAHVHLTMLQNAARVSTKPEFLQLMDDIYAWLGQPAGANGEFSVEQQERFAEGFEAYLADGKAPNKKMESVFEKFAQWLAEIYKQAKDYLQITPEVRNIFDRLLAPEETIQRSKVGNKLEAAKQLVAQMKKGNGMDIDGLSVADMKALLKTLSTRKPTEPKNNLLKDLRKYGANYANAGQIDKEAYKNAKIYDKDGGVDDKPDVWLEKHGYMQLENGESTEQTVQNAWDIIQRALDGEKVYRLEDLEQAESRAAFEENLATILQVFPDVKTAQETLKSITQLEEQGYRAVEAKDLEDLRRTVWDLERMVGRIEAESTKANAEGLEKKKIKITEDAKRIKRRVMEELDKRQLEHKEDMKRLLKAAQTPDEIHSAAAGVLDMLEQAWANTTEGQQEQTRLEVPHTNWDRVRVNLLRDFNKITESASEEIRQAQETLSKLPLGRILSEDEVQAKETAEKVLAKSNLDGQYVAAMQRSLRDLPHISYSDVAKYTAYLAKSNKRYHLLTERNIGEFIREAKKMQERNYRKYMTGKINAIFQRKVFEKVGSARRAKYNPEAMTFLQEGAQIWRGMTKEQAAEAYEQRLTEAGQAKEKGVPLGMFEILRNQLLELKATPDTLPLSAFAEMYQTALAAVRGDAYFKKLDTERRIVRENNIRLALAAALEERKLGKVEIQYLLHGGTDFQTALSVLFGETDIDMPNDKGVMGKQHFNFRDLLSPETQQMRATNFKHEAGKQILAACMDAYGFTSPDQAINKVYELQQAKMKMLNYGHIKDEQAGQMVAKIYRNGKLYTNNRVRTQTISKEELLTFYLWNKDHEIVEVDGQNKDVGLSGRLVRAYGLKQLNDALSTLTAQDKRFADNLQKVVEGAYDLENETHRRIYGFSLPKKEFYFPSVTERTTDTIDYIQHIVDNAKAPGFIKKRTQSNMPVQAIVSPTKLVLQHMNRASEFIYEAEKYTELLRLFKQSEIQDVFAEKFGEHDGKALYNKLMALINLQGPSRAERGDELFKVANTLFNGWVKSALGLKVMTGVKQFASCISFAEDMPAATWAKWFAEGLASPQKTAAYMHQMSPYIQARYEMGGVNEAVARAMAEEEISPFATKAQTFTNVFLLNTRLGDKASLIYGGYPYMRYLTEVKKLSQKEAARQFELQAVRTLQSSLKANLSEAQANAGGFGSRLFLTFKNQQMQYARRLVDTYVQYKNGQIDEKQFGKAVLLYVFLNPIIYTALGLGWLSHDDDERKKDWLRLFASPVTQSLDAWPLAGGLAEYVIESAYNLASGEKLPLPDRMGMPMFDDFYRDMVRAVKNANADEVSIGEWAMSALSFTKYLGLPLNTLETIGSGLKDVVTGKPVRGGMKVLGYSKNRSEKVTGTKENKKSKKNIIRR